MDQITTMRTSPASKRQDIGVVGPVRTGKSTFIKQFMETLVLPHLDDEIMRARTTDELPQSGTGKAIMTSEPKFVPEEAVSVSLTEDVQASVRLIDSVGFMIPGAAGQFDETGERLVTTPWFDHEIPMREAAEDRHQKGHYRSCNDRPRHHHGREHYGLRPRCLC